MTEQSKSTPSGENERIANNIWVNSSTGSERQSKFIEALAAKDAALRKAVAEERDNLAKLMELRASKFQEGSVFRKEFKLAAKYLRQRGEAS